MGSLFTEVFNWIPLAHVIDNRVLVGYLTNILVQCTLYLKATFVCMYLT